MIGRVLLQLVVVAAHIKVSERGLHVFPGLLRVIPGRADRGGHWARGVELLYLSGKLAANYDTLGLRTFGNLIADAPKNNAGMIAVALDHGFNIALPPLLEIEAVVLRILTPRPAVEGLIDHQHAQAVAGIEEIGRGRIVTGTDSIEAARLEQLDTAFLSARNACGAERAVIVMNAPPSQLVALAIDPQPISGVDLDLADADADGSSV